MGSSETRIVEFLTTRSTRNLVPYKGRWSIAVHGFLKNSTLGVSAHGIIRNSDSVHVVSVNQVHQKLHYQWFWGSRVELFHYRMLCGEVTLLDNEYNSIQACPLDTHPFRTSRQATWMSNLTENFLHLVYAPRQLKFFYAMHFSLYLILIVFYKVYKSMVLKHEFPCSYL